MISLMVIYFCFRRASIALTSQDLKSFVGLLVKHTASTLIGLHLRRFARG